MSDSLLVYTNRTNILEVHLGYDVSNDTITSEIREYKDPESDLIATWDVTFLSDGEDGKLRIVLDNSVVADITQRKGYMDFKRVSNGEPLPEFKAPLRVQFVKGVTA